MPAIVHSNHSPWYAYLHAVYGDGLKLPFDLRRLNFFYHNDERWRRRFPHVEWPLAACETSATKQLERLSPHLYLFPGRDDSFHFFPQRGSALCASATCARWTVGDEALASPKAMAPVTHGAVLPGRHGKSSATLIWRQLEPAGGPPHAEDNLRRVSRDVAHDRGLLEVIRMVAPFDEGKHGLGCWWFEARGSGIWIHTGRALRVSSDSDLDLVDLRNARSAAGDEWRAWAEAHESAAAPILARGFLKRRVGGGVDREIYPMQAKAMGYDSVLVGFNQSEADYTLKVGAGYPMLVTLSTACTKSSAPIRTCPPVELRTGWPRARNAGGSLGMPSLDECGCDESEPLLNCDAPRSWRTASMQPRGQPIRGPWVEPSATCRSKRVAVCLVGLPRTFSRSHVQQSIVQRLVGGLRAHSQTVDVFAVFNVDPPGHGALNDAEPATDEAGVATGLKALRVRHVERVTNGGQWLTHSLHNYSRCEFGTDWGFRVFAGRSISQMAAWARCYAAILEAEMADDQRYDWVVQARPDMVWVAPLPPLCASGRAAASAIEHPGHRDHFFALPRSAARVVLWEPYVVDFGVCEARRLPYVTSESWLAGKMSAAGFGRAEPLRELPPLVVRNSSREPSVLHICHAGATSCGEPPSVPLRDCLQATFPEEEPWQCRLCAAGDPHTAAAKTDMKTEARPGSGFFSVIHQFFGGVPSSRSFATHRREKCCGALGCVSDCNAAVR